MKNWLHQYRWPLVGFVIALVLHLWQIGTPAQIVSDEISFVTDGRAYVQHSSYFDPHPPFGKELIGAAITVFGDHPSVWRWPSALMGATIIPLLWCVTWGLTRNKRAAELAVLLGLLDGLRLVDSRLAMLNTTYIAFGLAAVACLFEALRSVRWTRWLLFAGMFSGVAIATKWLAALLILPALILWIQPQWFGLPQQQRKSFAILTTVYMLLIPATVYASIFALHFFWLGETNTFVSLNVQMLKYHLSVPSTGDPQQLSWLSWPLMTTPFRYWRSEGNETFSVLQSLPNPWLWWTGMLTLFVQMIVGWKKPLVRALNVFALFAWLPFFGIQRIMYSYHTMMLSVWLIVLVAVVLQSFWQNYRRLVCGYLAIALFVFLWFLPWYLNLPMSAAQHRLRQWLPTWTVSLSDDPVTMRLPHLAFSPDR